MKASKAIPAVCIFCGNKYWKRIGSKNYKNSQNLRGKNTVTCSKLCSSKYSKLHSKFGNQRKKLKKSLNTKYNIK